MKPLLAYRSTPPLDQLQYPVLASPKLDGIRCIIRNIELEPATTRSLKPVPNTWVQLSISNLIALVPECIGLDGELMVNGTFSEVQSSIMSHEGEPAFTFNAFDHVEMPRLPFYKRLSIAEKAVKAARKLRFNWVQLVEHQLIKTPEELEEYEQRHLRLGYEGVMVRNPIGLYKYGRSTLREGILIKIKRHSTAEAVIHGYEELMHNENPATINELGKTERSSAKAGLRRTGKLGALLVTGTYKGELASFAIGSGFDDAQRAHYWKVRHMLLGKKVTYKFQPDPGYSRPRQPIFLGIRHNFDL